MSRCIRQARDDKIPPAVLCMVAQAAVLYYYDAVAFLQNNNLVILAIAGIQLERKFRDADKTLLLFRFTEHIESTGFTLSRE